jgi:hypothetical protein
MNKIKSFFFRAFLPCWLTGVPNFIQMKKFLIVIIVLMFSATVSKGQFIAQVLEYVPAPGQLINTALWGSPSSAESIVGGVDGHLSLGSYGGYVVFRFDQPVINHPDHPFGVDFTIFGNAYQDWSEPAVVWVMKDENQNGLPDDTWYELAGSDYHFTTTKKNYKVTWINPAEPVAADVYWLDNLGAYGNIRANTFYTQPYYPLSDSFPGVNSVLYQLKGTSILPALDSTNPAMMKSYQRAFGYADNRQRGAAPYTLPGNPYTPETENAGGDAFDLHWAVDSLGNYVDLDTAHFVKVQNAVLANAAILGEVSTEIAGAALALPQPGIPGGTKMMVVKDLPTVIKTSGFQLEAFAFAMGRWQKEAELIWQTNQPWAMVDEKGLLQVDKSGTVEITVYWEQFPEISKTIIAQIELSSGLTDECGEVPNFSVYPTPATENIVVAGAGGFYIEIFNTSGIRVKRIENYDGRPIPVQSLPKGLYLIHLKSGLGFSVIKFVKS